MNGINSLWLFHSDCLAYSLFFHGSNNIQSGFGINHWIPFSEEEVGASGLFKSSFMVDFIRNPPCLSSVILAQAGISQHERQDLSLDLGDSRLRGNDGESNGNSSPLEFSEQAKDLFTCCKKLWQYHQEVRNDVNYLNDASFYDIRKYFQGSRGLSTANPPFADLSHRAKTRMNNKSSDAEYNVLISELRKALKTLGEERIVEKVFEYGFLLR